MAICPKDSVVTPDTTDTLDLFYWESTTDKYCFRRTDAVSSIGIHRWTLTLTNVIPYAWEPQRNVTVTLAV